MADIPVFPWVPGTDFRPPVIVNVLRDFWDAQAAIDAKAATLNWIGAVKGDMQSGGGTYFKEYEHATIYCPRNADRKYTTAYEVHGHIRDRYKVIGGSRSVLGAPLSDELTNGDGTGRHSRFQNGLICWSAGTYAFEIYGPILARWDHHGGTRDFGPNSFGYPLSGEIDIPGGRMNSFERGQIILRNGTVTEQRYRDALIQSYNNQGGISSRLGLPLDPAMPIHRSSSAMSLNFRGGVILINLNSPDVQTYTNTTIRVTFTGLECQVRQERNDELIGCVSAFVQATKQIRAQEFPPQGEEEWKLGHDQQRIMPAYSILYEGPPAGIVLTASLLENDSDINAGAWADQFAAFHTSVRADTVVSLYDRLSNNDGSAIEAPFNRERTPIENYQRGIREVMDPALQNHVASWGVSCDHYPTRLIVVPWNGFEKEKKWLRREDDPHTVSYTEMIVLDAKDADGDLGVYAFYFDVGVVWT
ncbi:LGFP-domain-containing protein [Sporormia fimetaria CBS 119925]|uniref:LGFP-domain-containing protein n=1 Tax=Sporormia fimetaria CBS 119925 TaxID=1340428 RepID=A0A6A6V8U1_9PLEO|nr:LGFP-domain-containing protein [Sporormia fimetaria CBS 119925]